VANVMELLQDSRRLRGKPHQALTTGVIAGFEAGRYLVVSGQTTWQAVSGVGESLANGDRVYIVQGQGITKIVGLLGADESANG
jgi:membrane protein implicated in regulation of membrane protease activity